MDGMLRMRQAIPILTLLVLAGAFARANDVPQTTPEGMELINQDKSRIVYAMPGATLDGYTKVALLDCQVAFRKDWQRDINRSSSFSHRVSASDMEKIKQALAEEFHTIFTEELREGGYEVVDHTGDEVLVVRPAIVDLDITAPDVGSAGRSRVVVRSAGQMTLLVELYDSVTGAIIARAMDAQASDSAFGMEANRVTNKREADKILREWARALRSNLGAVAETTGSPKE